jgi:hypothetical protein
VIREDEEKMKRRGEEWRGVERSGVGGLLNFLF